MATTNQKRLDTEIARRRSFAIIAHPDAGKTTLTEKLLLYGGAIHLAGHVRARKNRRNTRSDWMKMEQERGISVSSAALQFNYEGYQLNLLDTPGHKDFSEDTYRTLMAADTAVMLLDAARGVQTETIKLFHVCRERNLPIVSFINKMDMPAKDTFALLDEIEKVLGISVTPLAWPIGSGRDFRGIYDLQKKQVHWYTAEAAGSKAAPTAIKELSDPQFKSELEPELYVNFCESVTLAQEALPDFDTELFLAGELSPVFFGSAINNFGLDLFLERFVALCPPPQSVLLGNQFGNQQQKLAPNQDIFSAFVFKLQANMNQKHRDRIAFVRITSGAFQRGMSVYHNRLQKNIRLSNPVAFFGQERSTIDEAFAGDIIGLSNPGVFCIGDIISSKADLELPMVPRFAPEIFARLNPQDTSKLKQFRRGLQELAEEGVVQVFRSAEGQPILGAVGQLQFETFRYRLQDEYGAPCVLETLAYECSRWFDGAEASAFSSYDRILHDLEGRPVVLFQSLHRLRSFQNDHPNVKLYEHPPPAA